jgi:hypothetical protein
VAPLVLVFLLPPPPLLLLLLLLPLLLLLLATAATVKMELRSVLYSSRMLHTNYFTEYISNTICQRQVDDVLLIIYR